MSKEFRFIGPLTRDAYDAIKKHYSATAFKHWQGNTNFEYAITQGVIKVVHDSQLADNPIAGMPHRALMKTSMASHLPIVEVDYIAAFLEETSLEEELRNIEQKYGVELAIQPKAVKPGDIINAKGREYMVVGAGANFRMLNTKTNELVHGVYIPMEAKTTAHMIVNMLKRQP